MLTDTRLQFAAQIGIRYELPDYLAELYAKFGLDLPGFHEDDGFALPIPARLIVDQAGVVRFSEASADYTRRPEPADTLTARERPELLGGARLVVGNVLYDGSMRAALEQLQGRLMQASV